MFPLLSQPRLLNCRKTSRGVRSNGGKPPGTRAVLRSDTPCAAPWMIPSPGQFRTAAGAVCSCANEQPVGLPLERASMASDRQMLRTSSGAAGQRPSRALPDWERYPLLALAVGRPEAGLSTDHLLRRETTYLLSRHRAP